MTLEELGKVLAKIKLGDNREITEAVMLEWFDTIGHLRFEDAIDAVRLHRQSSTDYLQAAHVVRGVGRLRETRLPPRALPSPGSCVHKVLAGACVLCGWLPEEAS